MGKRYHSFTRRPFGSRTDCSALWKRVIAWERSRAASGYGIIWGTQIETNKEEFSAELNVIAWIVVVTASF